MKHVYILIATLLALVFSCVMLTEAAFAQATEAQDQIVATGHKIKSPAEVNTLLNVHDVATRHLETAKVVQEFVYNTTDYSCSDCSRGRCQKSVCRYDINGIRQCSEVELSEVITSDEKLAISLCAHSMDLIKQSSALYGEYVTLEASYAKSFVQRQKDAMSHNTAIYSSQRLQTTFIFIVALLIVLGGFFAAFYELVKAAQLREKGNSEETNTGNTERDIEITLSYNQVAVKTTQNGIAIFVITLLFFLIYVYFVYPITKNPNSEMTFLPSSAQCDPETQNCEDDND